MSASNGWERHYGRLRRTPRRRRGGSCPLAQAPSPPRSRAHQGQDRLGYDDALTLDEFKLEQERIGHETRAAQAAIAQWTIEIDAMRRSLDEALSLLADPYRLYTEAPEGINLMLIQAICEKVWILDTGVVGVDLTTLYAELLTVEARLALAETQRAAAPMTTKSTDREG